jgi:hypothetical protein
MRGVHLVLENVLPSLFANVSKSKIFPFSHDKTLNVLMRNLKDETISGLKINKFVYAARNFLVLIASKLLVTFLQSLSRM